MMRMDLFKTREQARLSDRERAAEIKANLSFLDYAEGVGLDPHPSRGAHACDCPACRNVAKAAISTKSEAFKCSECGASGDVIEAERLRHGGSFRAVCYALELLIERRGAGQVGPGLFDVPPGADAQEGGR